MTQSLAIADAFDRLFRARPGFAARKWWNIDCPMCGDRRKRLGFVRSATGGFRIYCQNGGCSFHDKPSGWESGNGLRGRLMLLFTKLGGDVGSLPEADVAAKPKRDNVQQVIEVRHSFPSIDLPRGSIPLIEALEKDPLSHKVGQWLVNKRSEVYLQPEYSRYLFWSATKPNILRVAFLHHDKIVGYLDRDVTKKGGKGRFMQRCESPDYLFGQHIIADLPGEHVYVVESPMDAILLHGVATRSSRPQQSQINFLLQCGKKPIWIPDLKDKEGELFIETAKTHKHLVAVPDWEFKDPGESFIPNGVLNTAHLIFEAKTDSYSTALMNLRKITR